MKGVDFLSNISTLKYLHENKKPSLTDKKIAFYKKNFPLKASKHCCPQIILKDNALHEKLVQNSKLIGLIRPLLNKAFSYCPNKENMILLTDEDGYIIDIISSPEILLECFQKSIYLGTCLNFNSFGTTAVSIAKYENQLTILLGKDHSCPLLKNFNCISTPISINSKIIGFLNITTNSALEIQYFSGYIMILLDLIKATINNNEIFFESIDSKKGKSFFLGCLLVNSNFLFTIKETEILYYIYLRKSSKQIVSTLFISSNTLKTHIQHIYQKLNISSSNECLNKIQLLLNI